MQHIITSAKPLPYGRGSDSRISTGCHIALSSLLLAVGFMVASARADALPENPYAIDRQRACGAMCIAFLDSYFGGTRAYSEVSIACRPGPLGSSLQELQKAAGELGYYTLAVEGSVDALKRLQGPVIAHCQPDKGPGHFLVLLEWNEAHQRFRLFDPPSSLGECSEEKLREWITGFFLIVSDKPIPQNAGSVSGSSSWLHWFGLELVVAGVVLLSFRRKRAGFVSARLLAAVIALGFGMPVLGCSASTVGDVAVAARPDRVREIDCGEVLAGENLKAVFQIDNDGDEPFRVVRVDRSCSCHGVDVESDAPIESGKSVSINISVPTSGAEGRIMKTFEVVTDSSDPKYAVIHLVLSGTVWRPLKAVPSEIMFGSLRTDGACVKRLVVLANPAQLADRFVAATSSDPLVIVELKDRRPGELQFDIRIAPGSPQGVISGEIRIGFDYDRMPALRVPFLGRRDGVLASTPARVTVAGAASLERKARVRVASTTGDEFTIVSTACPAGVTALWEDAATLLSSHEGFVVSSAVAEVSDGYVFVKTSLPGDQVLRIPVSSK